LEGLKLTAQIPDSIIYEGEEFSLVGVKGKGLYIPEDFGIEPHFRSTACWRGYVMRYSFNNGQLILDRILINTNNPLKINEIEPQNLKEIGSFDYCYENINFKTDFTGTLLLVKDFIQEMYVHMGFQRPMAYKTVIEIRIENGTIISTRDLSKNMEEYRKLDISRDAQPQSNSRKDIENWVKRTFSLDY
jgi:hypothetical protein